MGTRSKGDGEASGRGGKEVYKDKRDKGAKLERTKSQQGNNLSVNANSRAKRMTTRNGKR
jgi:hypothetical protein